MTPAIRASQIPVQVSVHGPQYDALVRHFYKNAMTDWDVAQLCEALDGAIVYERYRVVERIYERLQPHRVTFWEPVHRELLRLVLEEEAARG